MKGKMLLRLNNIFIKLSLIIIFITGTFNTVESAENNVDFIKIDVDGPDRLVLKGCLNTIKKCWWNETCLDILHYIYAR